MLAPTLVASCAALDRPLPESASLRPVPPCAGRPGAAGLSLEGAQSALGRPGGGFKAPTLTGAGVHQAQRQANDALVAYVAMQQPCDLAELMQHFSAPSLGEGFTVRKRFQIRLSYLVNKGRLGTINLAGKRYFKVPGPDDALAPVEPTPEPATAWVGTVVPQRQYNALHAPDYVPEPPSALRQGALDYQRVASRGVRC